MRASYLLFLFTILVTVSLFLLPKRGVRLGGSTEKNVTNRPAFVNSRISPDGQYQLDSYKGDYTDEYFYYQIFITNRSTGAKKRVFAGDFRTLDWKWINSGEIEVIYNCGTGCIATRSIRPSEEILLAQYKDGQMNKQHGWRVQFFE